MSAASFEAFLVRIYVDEKARAEFLADPVGAAVKAGLTPPEVSAAARIDRVGLDLISKSLERKRLRTPRKPS